MEFCAKDAVQGMANLYSTNCNHPGCDKIPSFGVEGSNKREFCAEHAVQGMIYLRADGTGPTTYKEPTFEELIPVETVEHALNAGFSVAKANAGSLVRAGMTYREVAEESLKASLAAIRPPMDESDARTRRVEAGQDELKV